MARRHCSALTRQAALFASFGNGSSQPSHRERQRGASARTGQDLLIISVGLLVCIDFLMSWKKFLFNLLSAASLLPRRHLAGLSLAIFVLGSWLPLVFLPGLICLVSCNLSWMRGKAINPSCFPSLWSFCLFFSCLFSPCVAVVFAVLKRNKQEI